MCSSGVLVGKDRLLMEMFGVRGVGEDIIWILGWTEDSWYIPAFDDVSLLLKLWYCKSMRFLGSVAT